MKCLKCGNEINGEICAVCGYKTNDQLQNVNDVVSDADSNKKKNVIDLLKRYKIIVIILILLFIAGVICLLFVVLNKEDRAVTLLNISGSKVKFKLDDNEYTLGDSVSTLIDDGLNYDNSVNENTNVLCDSITSAPIYMDDSAKFLGAFYCSSDESCKFNDTILVKANFYVDSNVIVNDYLKIGLKYDDVKEKYGREDGEFYQDESMLVWSFGDEIGDAYYILGFDSSNKVSEIRIGVWWYAGESEIVID